MITLKNIKLTIKVRVRVHYFTKLNKIYKPVSLGKNTYFHYYFYLLQNTANSEICIKKLYKLKLLSCILFYYSKNEYKIYSEVSFPYLGLRLSVHV